METNGWEPLAVAGGTALVVGFVIGIIILCLIIAAFYIFVYYKIFKKAGKEGWKAIIPIYNTWVLCEIVGVNPYWVLVVVGASMLSSIPVISVVSTAVAIYFNVILNISLARSFGKSDGFGVCAIFFSAVCYPILAFDKSKYLGPKPMDDVVLNAINKNKDSKVKEATVVEEEKPAKEEKKTAPKEEKKEEKKETPKEDKTDKKEEK